MRTPLQYFREEILEPTRALRMLGCPEKDSPLHAEINTMCARRRSAIFKILWPVVTVATLIGGAVHINAKKTLPDGGFQTAHGYGLSHNFEPWGEYDSIDGGLLSDSEADSQDGGPPIITKEEMKLLNLAGKVPLTGEEAENMDNLNLTRITAVSMNIAVNGFLKTYKGDTQRARDIYGFYRQHAVPRLYTKDGKPMRESGTDPNMFYFDSAKKNAKRTWEYSRDLCYFDPLTKTLFLSDAIIFESKSAGANREKAGMEFAMSSTLQIASFLIALNDAFNCMSGNCEGRLTDPNLTSAVLEADEVLKRLEESFLVYLGKYGGDNVMLLAAMLLDATYNLAKISFVPDEINFKKAKRFRGRAAYILARWLLARSGYEPKLRQIQPQLADIINVPNSLL